MRVGLITLNYIYKYINMFILRRITSDGNELDTIIGKSYSPIRKIENRKEYEKTLKIWLGGLKTDDDNIYGFIVSENGKCITPLYKKSVYFVMCSDGKTFANISLK